MISTIEKEEGGGGVGASVDRHISYHITKDTIQFIHLSAARIISDIVSRKTKAELYCNACSHSSRLWYVSSLLADTPCANCTAHCTVGQLGEGYATVQVHLLSRNTAVQYSRAPNGQPFIICTLYHMPLHPYSITHNNIIILSYNNQKVSFHMCKKRNLLSSYHNPTIDPILHHISHIPYLILWNTVLHYHIISHTHTLVHTLYTTWPPPFLLPYTLPRPTQFYCPSQYFYHTYCTTLLFFSNTAPIISYIPSHTIILSQSPFIAIEQQYPILYYFTVLLNPNVF